MVQIITALGEGVEETLASLGITQRLRGYQQIRKERAASVEARSVKFVLHPHARTHDFFIIYMMLEEGWREGLVARDFEIISDRAAAPSETDAEALVRQGVIPVCVGQGPWSKVGKEDENDSAVLNTARWLGILGDPVWDKLARWVHSSYLPPGPGNWEATLGLIRTMSLAHLDDQIEAYGIAESIFGSIRAEVEEEQFALSELSKKIVLNEKSITHRGRGLKVGIVQTDALLAARTARNHLKVDVLIRVGTAGDVVISSNRGVDLSRVAFAIRAEEDRLAGGKGRGSAATGLVSSDDRWFYKVNQPGYFEALINGGLTHPHMPATRIESNKLILLVVDALEGR